MSTESVIATIILSVITALSSSKAWDYYKQKLIAGTSGRDTFHNTLKDQIKTMTDDLKQKEAEIKKLNILVTNLAQKLSAMTVRVEFLEKENAVLKGA
jgi:hypothetical protein